MTDDSVLENRVSAGTGSDVRTFLAAALLTYCCGVLALNGAILLETLGFILGLVVAGWGVLLWRKGHGKKAFPRDLPVRSVVILVVLAVVLTGLAVLLFRAV